MKLFNLQINKPTIPETAACQIEITIQLGNPGHLA